MVNSQVEPIQTSPEALSWQVASASASGQSSCRLCECAEMLLMEHRVACSVEGCAQGGESCLRVGGKWTAVSGAVGCRYGAL